MQLAEVRFRDIVLAQSLGNVGLVEVGERGEGGVELVGAVIFLAAFAEAFVVGLLLGVGELAADDGAGEEVVGAGVVRLALEAASAGEVAAGEIAAPACPPASK